MNIIRDLSLWFKACFGTLSADEFKFMCLEFDRHNGKRYRSSLTAYLIRRKQLSTEEINTIYAGSSELQWFYLERLPLRKLSEYEQSRLVTAMPMGKYARFPCEIEGRPLEQLMKFRNVRKLDIYIQDFILPEKYELQLLDYYKLDVERHRYLLEAYLSNKQKSSSQPFSSKTAQEKFLATADDVLLIKWAECLTLQNNFLTEQSIMQLIKHGNSQLMKTYLFHTYLPNAELQHQVLDTYPELKWELEISKLRRPLWMIEQRQALLLGASEPTDEEYLFMVDTMDTIDSLQDRELYIRERLPQRLLKPTSPYLCAWIAYEYPELAKKAYENIRKTAEQFNNKKRCH